MASSSCSAVLEIPKLFLFTEGGIYSGGKYDKSFNYKVVPANGKMTCYIWFGKNCIDKTENVESREFALDTEGHTEMVKWIENRYLEAPLTNDYPSEFFEDGISIIP